MIRVLYFASLRERLGTGAEELEPPVGVKDVGGLAEYLGRRGGRWSEVFDGDQTVMMALNQEAAKGDAQINDGDEVAFFPPVTGG